MTPQQRKVMELALEAYLCREMPAGTVIGDPKWWAPKIANAIKKALAQPAQPAQPLECTYGYNQCHALSVAKQCKPEQEPVATFDVAVNDKTAAIHYDCRKHKIVSGTKLYTSPPAQSQPLTQDQFKPDYDTEAVLVVEKEPDYMSRGHFYTGTKPHIDPTKVWSLPVGTKLYTTPPQRKPLTPVVPEGADINQRVTFKAGWRSAEAAHGIKE